MKYFSFLDVFRSKFFYMVVPSIVAETVIEILREIYHNDFKCGNFSKQRKQPAKYQNLGAAPLSRLDFTQIYLRKVEIIAFCEKLLSRMDFL